MSDEKEAVHARARHYVLELMPKDSSGDISHAGAARVQ